MTMPPIMLPQEYNGSISTELINENNGLLVRIPRYTDAVSQDVVSIILNDAIRYVFIVTNPSELPRIVTVENGYNINGENRISYRVIDIGGNIHYSDVKTFIISGDDTLDFTLATTSGAEANGTDTNQAIVTLKKNNEPQSGKKIILTITGSATFANGSNTTTVYTTDLGVAQATFVSSLPGSVTVLASYEDQSRESISTFVNPVALPTLVSYPLSNNIPAGGDQQFIIQYQLRNANATPIYPGYIQLSSESSAISFTTNLIQTDSNGLAYAYIKSTSEGSFTITATSLSIINHTKIEFSAVSKYSLLLDNKSSQAIANGVYSYDITFALINDITSEAVPYANFILETNSPISLPSTVIADSNGLAKANITSLTAGIFSVTVTSKEHPSISQKIDTRFVNGSPGAPILIISVTKNLPIYTPIQTLLSDVYFQSGRIYNLTISKLPQYVKNCAANYVYDAERSACVLGYTSNVTFHGTTMEGFTPTVDGWGRNLRSPRYYYYPGTTGNNVKIDVYDYGP